MAKLTLEALERALRANPRAKAAQLCSILKVEQSTLSRVLRRLSDQVITLGKASRTRYAWRRAVRTYARGLPLYQIDTNGAGQHLGGLDCVYPSGAAVTLRTELGWPVDDDMRDGWHEGLPYWLLDMKPQGFLGRNFAKRHSRILQVSEDLNVWSDDDVLHILATLGADQPGNLIVGDAAYELFLESSRRQESSILQASQVSETYPQLAATALSLGEVGSSAGGEFPKFTACRFIDDDISHVIVKFSGSGDSPAESRWSDLLVCEHIALNCMQEKLGVASARSSIHRFEGRTFLEIERFDRHGLLGRSEVCSLMSVNAALVGSSETSWSALASSLVDLNYLDEQQANVMNLCWWFGRLIGNSDMHFGNLSFVPGLKVAPAYDMLPMRYAPLRGGELPAVGFEVAEPLPRDHEVWRMAMDAAIFYWDQCASDSRIGDAFRGKCKANSLVLKDVLQRIPIRAVSKMSMQ